MSERTRRPLGSLASLGVGSAGAALLVLLLATWTWWPWRGTNLRLDLVVYVVAGTAVLFDTLDFALRLYFRHVHGGTSDTSVPLDVGRFTPYQMRLQLRPFAIIASVHNLAGRAEAFVAGLGPFRDRLFVIDDASTDDTAAALERLGVRVTRSRVNRKKPGALRVLMRVLPADVASVIVMDPDVSFDLTVGPGGLSSLERMLFDFQRSGMAAACPRIVVREEGLWSDLQSLEYTIALEIGRKALGDRGVTSGVSIYRRDALEHALSVHSLSVYAEDFSNALILLSSDERIYYDGRLVVSTTAQRSWRRLFSQRVGWAFGLIQVYVRDFDRVLRASAGRPLLTYQLLVYAGAIGLLMHPVRVVGLGLMAGSLLNGLDNALGLEWIPDTRWLDPVHLLAAYVNYTLLVVAQVFVAFARRDRRRIWPIVPLYFVYTVGLCVPITIGYLNWISLRVVGRRLYHDHYETDDALIRQQMAAA